LIFVFAPNRGAIHTQIAALHVGNSQQCECAGPPAEYHVIVIIKMRSCIHCGASAALPQSIFPFEKT
jgi:hypothetical protein